MIIQPAPYPQTLRDSRSRDLQNFFQRFSHSHSVEEICRHIVNDAFNEIGYIKLISRKYSPIGQPLAKIPPIDLFQGLLMNVIDSGVGGIVNAIPSQLDLPSPVDVLQSRKGFIERLPRPQIPPDSRVAVVAKGFIDENLGSGAKLPLQIPLFGNP